ncbi:MAG: hypothetical protein LUD01_04425 [Clostridiales bacterium]|nr:hypothetical protein [Clostridiales bacterium]
MNVYELESDKNYINYQDLRQCEETLLGEYNGLGAENFIAKYHRHIGFYTKTWRTVRLRYLLGMLETICPEFVYAGDLDERRPMKPIVLNEVVFDRIVAGEGELLNKLAENAPSGFLKYGILPGGSDVRL